MFSSDILLCDLIDWLPEKHLTGAIINKVAEDGNIQNI